MPRPGTRLAGDRHGKLRGGQRGTVGGNGDAACRRARGCRIGTARAQHDGVALSARTGQPVDGCKVDRGLLGGGAGGNGSPDRLRQRRGLACVSRGLRRCLLMGRFGAVTGLVARPDLRARGARHLRGRCFGGVVGLRRGSGGAGAGLGGLARLPPWPRLPARRGAWCPVPAGRWPRRRHRQRPCSRVAPRWAVPGGPCPRGPNAERLRVMPAR